MPNELKKLCSKFEKKNFTKKDFDDYFEVHNADEQVDAEIQIEYSEEKNSNLYGEENNDKMEIEGEDPIPIPNFIAPKEVDEDFNQDIKDYMDIGREQNTYDNNKADNQLQNKARKSRGRPKGNSKRKKEEEEIKDPKAEDIKNTIDNLMNIVDDQ